MAAIVALAIVVTAAGCGGDKDPGIKPRGVATQTGKTASKAPGCDPADTSQTIPQKRPPGVNWSQFKTVALPSSRTAGPTIVKGDVARCYARTPVGALIAASQISYRILLSKDGKKVVRTQTTPGKNQETVLRELADPGPQFPPGQELPQIAGFKFLGYTKDTAVIQLATRYEVVELHAGPVTMVWRNGDWKLQLLLAGKALPTQEIDTLDGYVRWQGAYNS